MKRQPTEREEIFANDVTEKGLISKIYKQLQFSSVVWSCPTLCDPMDCSTPGLPVHYQLLEFAQPHVHWVDDAIQPSHPLSSPSPFAFNLPSIRLFFNELVLHIRWPKYWSFSFSISPSNEHWGLISFRMDWFISLQSKGLSRVFFSIIVEKHQFCGAQLSLWPNSHIHTRLLEKPYLWLDRPLLAKLMSLLFNTRLGLSQLFLQGASVF